MNLIPFIVIKTNKFGIIDNIIFQSGYLNTYTIIWNLNPHILILIKNICLNNV